MGVWGLPFLERVMEWREHPADGKRLRLWRVIVQGLTALRTRIKCNNADRQATFRVTEAVAFGDFMLKRPLAHAADVGIALTKNGRSPTPRAAESALFKHFCGRQDFLHLTHYQPWISARLHQSLI
jgi:hypothetical protein